jgi:quercetin dioxygenase-like cupin family protein
MAKKATSRSAAQSAVRKKWHGRKTDARSSSRKPVKSKAPSVAAKRPSRPKQRIAVSHHREEHYHAVEFQMVYVLKGWVKTYMEGQGETLMKQGSAWTQPPKIKHMILDYSDDVELLEVILPANFKTVELTA